MIRNLVLTTALIVTSLACGGGGEPEVASTSSPSPRPSRTVDALRAYKDELRGPVNEAYELFGEEWETALSTEPLGGEAWQQAVNSLAGKIAAIVIRLEAITPPTSERANHALLVESLDRTAEAIRKISVAGAQGDVAALEEASAEIDIALEILGQVRR